MFWINLPLFLGSLNPHDCGLYGCGLYCHGIYDDGCTGDFSCDTFGGCDIYDSVPEYCYVFDAGCGANIFNCCSAVDKYYVGGGDNECTTFSCGWVDCGVLVGGCHQTT